MKHAVVAHCGLGDSVVILSLIPRLKEKYGDLIVYAAHPHVFEEAGVELGTIDDAIDRFPNFNELNIYRWCNEKQWQGSLQDAYAEMFGL
jgi:hypothetical protein